MESGRIASVIYSSREDCEPSMAVKHSISRFSVNPRIFISYDALNSEDRLLVDDGVLNQDHFLAQIAKPGRTRRIKISPPLYSVNISKDLRAIYRKTRNGIEVVELIRKKTLEKYGVYKSARSPSKRINPAKAKPAE